MQRSRGDGRYMKSNVALVIISGIISSVLSRVIVALLMPNYSYDSFNFEDKSFYISLTIWAAIFTLINFFLQRMFAKGK